MIYDIARILTFFKVGGRLKVLLDELGWERLQETPRWKQLAVCMYKMHNNLFPSYLKQIFTDTANVLAYNHRNSALNYYIPRPRTEFGKGSLQYRGSLLWNRISPVLRTLPILRDFQTSLNGKDCYFQIRLNMIKSVFLSYVYIHIFLISIVNNYCSSRNGSALSQ